MHALVLAGGYGSRIRPALPPCVAKSLQLVGSKVLLKHNIDLAIAAGATRVRVTTNPPYAQQVQQAVAFWSDGQGNVPLDCILDPNGHEHGVLTEVVAQLHALPPRTPLLTLNSDVYLHDCEIDLSEISAPHIFTAPIPAGANPSHFGQVRLEDGVAVAFVEKPEHQVSDQIFTGMALLDSAHAELAQQIAQASSEERVVAHLLSALVEQERVTYTQLPDKSFYDCGTIEQLMRAQRHALQS